MNAPAQLSALCRNAPAKHPCHVRPAYQRPSGDFLPRPLLDRAQVSLLDSRRRSGSGCSAAAMLLPCMMLAWHVHAGEGVSGRKGTPQGRDGVAGREVRAARARGGRAGAGMAVDILKCVW
jgi:hypothetical protein